MEADEEGRPQESRSEFPVGPPKGLGQGNAKRSSEVREEGPEDYHSGLGLSRTLREEEGLESGGGQNQQSATASCSAAEVPVGPPRVLGQDRKPLGPAENSNPVEPSGLGPVGTLRHRRISGRPRSAEASASASSGSNCLDPEVVQSSVTKGMGITVGQQEAEVVQVPVANSAPRFTVPVDKVRRPRGVKRDIILSCRPAVRSPVVFLTQNGSCLHSGCDCRPMQCSGLAIQRYLCPHCLDPDYWPTRRDPLSGQDRVVWLTKSGHAVHASATCPALAQDEEHLMRKLCRCCRWP